MTLSRWFCFVLIVALFSLADATENHISNNTIFPIIFFLGSFLLAAVIQYSINFIPSFIRPPYTVLLFLFAVGVSAIARDLEAGMLRDSIVLIQGMDPHVIFFVLLPSLLFGKNICL